MRDHDSQLRAVFFDLDDTLYDHSFAAEIATRSAMALDEGLRGVSFANYFSRSQALLEVMHPSVVSGQISFAEARNRRYELLATEFGGDRSRAVTQAQTHLTTYRKSERAVPGAHELLTALRQAGYPLFIVSNNTRHEQEGKLLRLGLSHFFDALILSGDHAFSKPDPRLFQAALQIAQVSAAQAVHVGDSYASDVIGAQSAGVRAIWFNRDGKLAPKNSFGALQIVGSFTDHEQTLKEIVSNSR